MNKLRLIVALIVMAPGIVNAEVIDRIVARVNDYIITESDLNEAIRRMKADGAIRSKQENQTRQEVLNALIDQKIMETEIERDKITVTDADVQKAFADLAKRYQTTPDGLKSRLREQRVTYEEYLKDLKFDLKRTEFVKKNIVTNIRISDSEVEDFYKRNIHEFTTFHKIRFQELLIAQASVPAGQSLDTFAGELVTQLRRGGNFTEAVKKYSSGPFAGNGGDSGILNIREMRQDLAGFLQNLKPGEISDPVKMPNAVSIFKLTSFEGADRKSFNDVKDMIRQKLGNDRVEEELRAYLRTLRSKSFVEIKP